MKNKSPLSGLKLIRTSKWDQMVLFYSKVLGMERRKIDVADSIVFYGYGTEIHLERVNDEAEHALLGSLELYSVNTDGLVDFLKRKGVAPATRTVGGFTEIILHDPDGYIVVITKTQEIN